MPSDEPVASEPVVSVIIPARNEEVCLGACLESLVAQTGVAFEIIVVDDHSTDRTREIAASFNVRVIEAGPLPVGWTGKNNAVTTGASAAKGEWLLFTDADTVHLRGSLAHALAEAKQYRAAMLSYSPEQVVETFWEKAVMPIIFAELAANFRPSEVSDPNSPAAAANGQYILITRAAYDAVGGHAAAAGDLLEDVALARAVKQSGGRIIFRYGGDAVRTRMYRSFLQLREGWIKNLALLFPSSLLLAALRTAEFTLIVAGFALAATAAFSGRTAYTVPAGLLAAILYGMFFRRVLRAHFSSDAMLLAILGLPLFVYLLVRSRIQHTGRTVTWKGRMYDQRLAIIANGTRITKIERAG